MRELIIIIATIALMLFSSCETSEEYKNRIKEQAVGKMNKYSEIVIIDSCEYITYETYGPSINITHKGNCKFCLIRSKK